MRAVIKKINATVQYVSCVAVVILMLMTVADVINRQFLGKSLPGVFELTPIFLTLTVFFAVAYANDNKEHVVIDVLYEILPRMGRKVFSYICTTINLVMVAIMCVVVMQYAIQLFTRNAMTSTLHVPMWPFAVLAAVGMLCYILSLIGDFIMLVKGGVLGNDPS